MATKKRVSDFLKSVRESETKPVGSESQGGAEPSGVHTAASEGSTPSPATNDIEPGTQGPPFPQPLTLADRAEVEAFFGTASSPNHLTLEAALAVIREHIDKKQGFTNAQMDLGVEMSLMVLAPSDQALFREIAHHNGIPLWQALWGQYRRCDEMGLAFTPILDPGWSPTEGVVSLGPRKCPICGVEFPPSDWGQIFCTDKCGTENERRIRDARLAEERAAMEAEAAKRKEAKGEPDVRGTEWSRLPEAEPMVDEVPAEVLE